MTATAVKFDRTTFRTSRLLDFCSKKELIAQTGHDEADWPLVAVKELLDNALDHCEEAGIAPEITVTADSTGITVEDNGTGMPVWTVKGILDFSVRMSSREAYVSPTRGAQGNAIKTIIAMPFVLDGKSGRVEITTQARQHRIAFSVDQIRQEPVVIHETVPSIAGKHGTKIHLAWPKSASSNLYNAKSRFLQIADDYTWLNPHLTLTVQWFDEPPKLTPATAATWEKWKPSDPTSAHWYDRDRLTRLIAAYVAHESGHKAQRTVREFVSEFRGLSGTAKQKAVLGETKLARMALADFVIDGMVDPALTDKLLAAMQANSKPVKAAMLGIIGEEHFRKRFEALGCEMESFDYRKIADTTEKGIPCLVEAAFAWRGEDVGGKAKRKISFSAIDVDDTSAGRRLITGVNWSPGIINPFRQLGDFGMSLDTILSRQRADRNEPVIFVLHVACPRVEYLDRGKSAVVVRS